MCKLGVALAVLTLLLGALAAGTPSDGAPVDAYDSSTNAPYIPPLTEILPGYYVEAGGVFLRRDTYQDDVLGAMQFGGGLAFAETRSTSLDFSHEPGLRATLG